MKKIKESIRSIPNFPIENVTFRDITTLMQDPEAFKQACDKFYERYKDKQIDKVVGIDARGLNGVPEVRYLEGPQMKKIIPQR